ncbi:MAG TPA: type II CAAX endopeptidase family protein [Pyrinomonadaceae bacterium]
MENPPIQFPSDSTREVTGEPRAKAAPDPDDPPWGLPGAVGLLILSFLLMIFISLGFLVPYALRRGVGLAALPQFALTDPRAILVQLLSIFPAHLLTLGLAWLLVTRGGKYPFFRTLGWEWGAGFTPWRCAGLALLLYAVGFGILSLSGECDNELERIIRSSRGAAIAAAAAASLTAPLVEEILFRGLLYSALRRLVGVSWAVAVVLIIFALIHVPQYSPCYGVIGTILLLSAVLTVVRARTRNLLPCFFIHLVFNSVQAVLIVLAPYLQRFIPPETPPVPAPSPGLVAELFLRLFGTAW